MADIVTGFGGVALGFVLSYFGTWLRDKLRAAADMRHLAGALAAELRGLAEVLPKNEPAVDTWCASQSYFSVFDSSAWRIGALGGHLASEVVACYAQAKRCVDTLQTAQAMRWDAQSRPKNGPLRNPLTAPAHETRKRAFAEVDETLGLISTVAEKLECIAGYRAN